MYSWENYDRPLEIDMEIGTGHSLAAPATGIGNIQRLAWDLNSCKRMKIDGQPTSHFTQHSTNPTSPAKPRSGGLLASIQVKTFSHWSREGGREDRNSADSEVRLRKSDGRKHRCGTAARRLFPVFQLSRREKPEAQAQRKDQETEGVMALV